MTDKNEPYSDAQGDVPQVDESEYSAFTSFILGQEHEAGDGLNLSDMDGISCATVHPQITKLVAEINAICEKENEPASILLTRLQQQIQLCLAGDVVASVAAMQPDELQADSVIVLDTSLLASILLHMSSLVQIIYEALADKFDDNKALRIARQMAEYIEATHEDDLPFFWDEVQNVLAGYEEADIDTTD